MFGLVLMVWVLKAIINARGQKWQEIEENIRTVQQSCSNILLGVNVTVSIFNIMHIPDFFNYLVEHKLVAPERINLYPLMYPKHFFYR
jgi:hypothetical protein